MRGLPHPGHCLFHASVSARAAEPGRTVDQDSKALTDFAQILDDRDVDPLRPAWLNAHALATFLVKRQPHITSPRPTRHYLCRCPTRPGGGQTAHSPTCSGGDRALPGTPTLRPVLKIWKWNAKRNRRSEIGRASCRERVQI